MIVMLQEQVEHKTTAATKTSGYNNRGRLLPQQMKVSSCGSGSLIETLDTSCRLMASH